MTSLENAYKKVLIAVDLNEPAEKLLAHAKNLIAEGVEVHICHAAIPLEVMYSFVPIGGYSVAVSGFQDEIMQHAQKNLEKIASDLGLANEKTHLLVGKASTEIKLFAKENNFDLIIVGTHGKNALRAALGSTSNGILHGAPCDVLALHL
jgi:universal stress protein A